ncbi:Uncharacterised protein [Klebsiella pneumoniae]|nr:Uncharacterised protein [Klebsiella pneumoniae]
MIYYLAKLFSIKTITNLSDTNCLEIHGASLRTLNTVNKHDCVRESDSSYKCNVTAVVDNEKLTAAVTLTRTDDGWQVIDR